MVACHCIHFLACMVITNQLLLVTSEVLGNKADDDDDDDDDIDFDNMPGVHHELKVEVGAGKEDCFFQYAARNAKLHVAYEVLRGGDRTINFYFRDPYNRVLDVAYVKSSAEVEKDVTEPGVYQICFDNTNTRFGSKLVFFSIVTFVVEEWSKFVIEVTELHGLTTNFSTSLKDVEHSVVEVTKYMLENRKNMVRDWYLLKGNNSYVLNWSLAQCAVILLAGACQVAFLRRMFKVATVTTTSKPRA